MSADINLDPGLTAVSVPQARGDVVTALASAGGSVAAAGSVSPSLPNPRLTVDPGLNRVVLEFFDSSGTLTNSIPSQKQLEAYRLAAFAGQSVASAEG